MRRLRARPSWVLLVAMGWYSPYPAASSRLPGTFAFS